MSEPTDDEVFNAIRFEAVPLDLTTRVRVRYRDGSVRLFDHQPTAEELEPTADIVSMMELASATKFA